MHILRRIPYYGFLALLIYMPFHIFLAQSLSLLTGGLEVWKVAKDVVLFALVLFTICLVLWEKKGRGLFFILAGLTVAYGVLHLVLWLTHPDIFTESALLGIVFNNRLPCFLLLGFGAVVLNRDKFVFSSVVKLVLFVSTLVAALGVLQYFLPKDLLTHLGYGLDRGTRAAFFIDDNPSLPRIMSTLREPNSLGAYLLVPIALLIGLLPRIKDGRRLMLVGALMLHLLAVFLTFSRSAWLAAVLVIVLMLWWGYQKTFVRLLQRFWPVLVGVLLLASIGLIAGRNSEFVKQYITHATEEQVADLDSNDYHKLLIQEGLVGVQDEPLGHGPGTAGLASLRSPDGGQLTENYYIQIAYEVGIIGLVIFLAINVLVYWQLWKHKTWVTLALISTFWGYVLINMLLHIWSNEAVAAQWWLLAGAALVWETANKKTKQA